MEGEQKIDVYNVYLEMGWSIEILSEIIKNYVDPRWPQNEHVK